MSKIFSHRGINQQKSAICIFLLLLVGLLMVGLVRNLASAAPIPTPDERLRALETAVRQALAAQDERTPIYILYHFSIDQLSISTDGIWGTARLTPLDPSTGNQIAAEYGLVLARWENGNWQVSLPGQADWPDRLQRVPDELVNAKARELLYWQYRSAVSVNAPDTPVGGFLLPWAGGKTLHLSRSITHYTPPNPNGDMHFAFDFALSSGNQPGSIMFELYAAKSGNVHIWRDHIPNGTEGTENANYLVIEDLSTSPPTYHLYLHLAQNSIPAELKVKDTPIQQGQYIGMADDTGYSTDHHLHFQVHTNPLSYWGKSIDITFSDVSINSGRPRTISESSNYPQYGSQGQTYYTSQNYPKNVERFSPIGDILEPLHATIITSSPLALEAWANDIGGGTSQARFMARFTRASGEPANSWTPISNWFTTPLFNTSWDLCSAGVGNGPLSLALELMDSNGNRASGLPGLRHASVELACQSPPPACIPTQDQIALFADPNFQGNCVILSNGKYSSNALGALGDNNAASIRVGKNVQATLYFLDNYSGRGTTFSKDNANLADDPIGQDTVSSVWVQSAGTVPSAPLPIWPVSGTNSDTNRSFTLSWENAAGAEAFQVVIYGPNSTLTSTWLSAPYFSMGSLADGSYTWKVRGKNPSNIGPWSNSHNFNTSSNTNEPPQMAVPYTASFEDHAPGWGTSGEWDLTDEVNHTTTPGAYISYKYDVIGGKNYDSGTPNGGHLTSPEIYLPPGEIYYLRFWYRVETENSGVHWDQRWVQISVDGAPFTNLVQLSSDRTNDWRLSPPISLAAYAGKSIQVRFDFTTIDKYLNNYSGWYIDDVMINTTVPPACTDASNSHTTAQDISLGTQLDADICPNGDVDYFRFNAKAGERIGVSIEADSLGSILDPVLQLIAEDGQTILAENDDRIPGVQTDSWLTFVLPHDGEYYLRVQAWDHPNVGGSEFAYHLRLVSDSDQPRATFTFPEEAGRIPAYDFELRLDVSDTGSDISHVEFFYHSADWQNGMWTEIGQDWDATDGWGLEVDGTSFPPASGYAFYAHAYDWAGNRRGVGVWNLANRFFGYIPITTK